MKEKEFWKDWKNKTKIEEDAIKVIKFARERILENIPKEEIVSIYVKGSFVRREMNKKSDVDLLIILKRSKFLKKIKRLEKENKNKFKPEVSFSVYTLWEMKVGRRIKMSKGRAAPSRMIKHLPYYQLIYGKELNASKFFKGDDKKIIRGMTKFFKNNFIPKYEEGLPEFGFSQLIKQVFWLTENEQRALGKNPPHSWKELDKSIKDKNHIVHDTLRLRLYPTKDKKIRAKYISKLKRYLDKLERI